MLLVAAYNFSRDARVFEKPLLSSENAAGQDTKSGSGEEYKTLKYKKPAADGKTGANNKTGAGSKADTNNKTGAGSKAGASGKTGTDVKTDAGGKTGADSKTGANVGATTGRP